MKKYKVEFEWDREIDSCYKCPILSDYQGESWCEFSDADFRHRNGFQPSIERPKDCPLEEVNNETK